MPPSAANVDFTYFWLRLLTEADPQGLGQQNIRKAIVRGLRDHIEFERRFQSGASRIPAYHPLPYGMAVELIRALEQVNAGESPLLFSPPRTKDGRGNLRTSSRQGAVDHAVRYVTAVQLGWIEEREPGERVARLYGVSRRQVQRWIKAAGSGSVRKKAVVDELAAQLRERYPDDTYDRFLRSERDADAERRKAQAMERLLEILVEAALEGLRFRREDE